MIIGNTISATIRCDRCDRETTFDVPRTTGLRATVRDDGKVRRVDVDDLIDEAVRNSAGAVFYDGGQSNPDWIHICDRCFCDPQVEDTMGKQDPGFMAEIIDRRKREGQYVGRHAISLGYFTPQEAAALEDDDDMAAAILARYAEKPGALS